MKWRTKLSLGVPAVLAVGIVVFSVGGSACFTSSVLNSAKDTKIQETTSLRVRHAYMDAKGRLVVLAEGGPWQSDRANTPRDPVWFMVDIATEAPKAKNGLITLPQGTLKKGTPDMKKLAQDGFMEVPFYEVRTPAARKTVDGAPVPTENPAVKVAYNDLATAKNFPEKLGYAPQFSVLNNVNAPSLPVELRDEKTESHAGALVMLPVAIVVDVVTLPFVLIFGVGMVASAP